jgi:ketosteroid isomerase-like protein
MTDWESVISTDKKEEWVTVWYTQHWETKKGEKDSSAIINDMRLKDGKIIRLNEYTRKLH